LDSWKYASLIVIIGLRSVVVFTSYFALILWLSLAVSLWAAPDLPVSTMLMAAHADLEGAQTLSR